MLIQNLLIRFIPAGHDFELYILDLSLYRWSHKFALSQL